MQWKKARGKLGMFEPLIGRWIAKADSPQGAVTCFRNFSKVLDNKFIELNVSWEFSDKVYEELAVIPTNKCKCKCNSTPSLLMVNNHRDCLQMLAIFILWPLDLKHKCLQV